MGGLVDLGVEEGTGRSSCERAMGAGRGGGSELRWSRELKNKGTEGKAWPTLARTCLVAWVIPPRKQPCESR